MKKIILFIALFFFCKAFSQKEANNWFFGQQAGIQFMDDGSVQLLNGSQMNTNEGCSSMSDTEGNLLFYTDGRNVWDRNHVIMPNGNYNANTGLLGDPSSTQSGIIVPKKGDPNIYYIFTVDEPHHTNASVYPNQYTGTYDEPNGFQSIPEADDGFNNGLNYSVVDLSITGTNGSIGDVSLRNQHLLTYNPDITNEAKYKCSEKITAVKNNTGTGYWVVTHFIDKFYSFFIDDTGVTETPVITQITPVVPTEGYRRNAIGCIKASPDGAYIGIAHQQLGLEEGGTATNGGLYLYNFNNATGVLSNPVIIKNNARPYGLEFSPEVKKLYVSYDAFAGFGGIHQYDLESADIPASDVLISGTNGASTMQLGPNGKIYRAVNGSPALDVINSPEESGALCGYVAQGVALQPGRIAVFGLPPFITSIFSAAITFENTCFGEQTEFILNVSNTFDSVTWNFGDGSPVSTLAAPSHTYANPGIYTVTVSIMRQGEESVVSTTLTIHALPVANAAPNRVECDPDNDGIAQFDLSPTTTAILGTQNAATFEVRYYTSQDNAAADTDFITGTTFSNTANPQTLYARVTNKENIDCFALTSLQLTVTNTPIINGNEFSVCDDNALDGNDANGQATFNLPQVTAQLFSGTGFTTSYYLTEEDAENEVNPLIQEYYNVIPNVQTVYARIVNTAFTECFSIQPVTLTVNPLPGNIQNALLVQCDMGVNPDGFSPFNLSQADSQYTNNNPDIVVAYYPSVTEATDGIGAITEAYINTTNPETITARVTNTVTGCFRILPLTLQVNEAVFDAVSMERCDDDGTEDGLAEFDLTQQGFENAGNTVAYYAGLEDALLEQNAVSALYTTTVAGQQTVYARIETNNECLALREIVLTVWPLPDVEESDTGIVCLNTQDFITLDAGITGAQYTFLWSTGATTPTIMVNQQGVYTVTITDTTHATLCQKIRTITVAPSNIAQIDNVVIEDLRENNSVTLLVSPVGGVITTYLYSLDNPEGPWQESPYFDNVAAGVHTVNVYDENECGIVSQQIAVLEVPKFFTPNGDTVNDYWQITGLNGGMYYNSKLYIYDRYGKLLANISPSGRGWDGTYNGTSLPSTDYWYAVFLPDGRVVKGHFAMVR